MFFFMEKALKLSRPVLVFQRFEEMNSTRGVGASVKGFSERN